MKSRNTYFDIVSYSFGEEKREVTILVDGEIVVIREKPLKGTEYWLVQWDSLENSFGEKFNNGHPLFFGVLLQALHDNKTDMPICGVCLDDIDSWFQEGKLIGALVEQIVKGEYRASR